MVDQENTEQMPAQSEATQAPDMPGQPAQAAEAQPESAQPAQPVSLQPAQPVQTVLPTSGLAIAGMVLGIVALVTIPIPIIHLGSPVLAIVGLVLSIVGLNGVKKGRRKGRGIAMAGIILCAIVTVAALLFSAACSASVSSKSSSGASAKSSASATSEAAAEPSASSSAAADSKSSTASADSSTSLGFKDEFIGTWDMTYYDMNDEKLDKSALQAARDNGKDCYLQLNGDGSAVLCIASYREDFTWTVTGPSKGLLKITTASIPMKISDGVLVMEDGNDTLKFEKGEPCASVSDASPTPDAAADGVSPDLKETLDSYEAFMDEYVEFMQKYKDSGDTASMLQDYTDFLQKYTDFTQKIGQLDTSAMSDADLAYYMEVTNRVSQKLLAASV